MGEKKKSPFVFKKANISVNRIKVPLPSLPSPLPPIAPVMGNAATAKKGSEVESGESRAGSGGPLGGLARGRSPEAAGMVQASAAAGNHSRGP